MNTRFREWQEAGEAVQKAESEPPVVGSATGSADRLPIHCPACGKLHSGVRAFGSYMADGKTPCDGYDCRRCGHRWHIIRSSPNSKLSSGTETP